MLGFNYIIRRYDIIKERLTMNKIGTLITAGFMTIGSSTKAAKNVAETAIKHTPQTAFITHAAKSTDVFTQLKPVPICDEVKTFRAYEGQDTIKSGDTFTCFAYKDGVKFYTDPKFTTETYVAQEGLKTTFQACPEKAIPTKGFAVTNASYDASAPKATAKAAVNEFTDNYPAVQEHVVGKGETIWKLAKELSATKGQKASEAQTELVTKQILLMNGLTMQDAKNLKANSIIKLPTAKSIVKP